jgi:tripartite-type tricarboxylate transporter receptor subunit TctC
VRISIFRPSTASLPVFLSLVAFTTSQVISPGVNAEEPYPTRQITLVVPYAPGGVVDLTARLVAETMREKFNQPIIVQNKPGANGMLALADFVRAPADGYTLLLNNDGGLAIPPAVDVSFKWDPAKDYTPVAQVGEFTWAFLVNSQLPVKSIQEFIAYAKSHPDQLNFGSPGLGTLPHMATEMFMQQTGVKMTHVPYKGSAPALTDLMAGVLSMNIQSIPTVISQLSSDRLRVLAVLSKKPVDALADVPTMQASGVDGFDVSSWNGIFAPSGVSSAIRDKIAQVVAEAVRKPDVQERFRKLSLDPIVTDSATFATRYYSEVTKWKALAAQTGIKVTQ